MSIFTYFVSILASTLTQINKKHISPSRIPDDEVIPN